MTFLGRVDHPQESATNCEDGRREKCGAAPYLALTDHTTDTTLTHMQILVAVPAKVVMPPESVSKIQYKARRLEMPKLRDSIGPLENCPCGSGKQNGQCHKLRTVLALEPVLEPPAGTATVMHGIAKSPPEQSNGLVQICGSCGKALVVGVGVNQIENVIFKCARCGTHNVSRR